MIEILIGLVKQHTFEIVSAVGTVAALVYAARAHSIAKQAVKVTMDVSLTELRLKVQEEITIATHNLMRLEEVCQTSLIQWDKYFDKHQPTLGHQSKADAVRLRIDAAKNSGKILLDNLLASAPPAEIDDLTVLENFIRKAKSEAIKIRRLGARLDHPTEFYE